MTLQIKILESFPVTVTGISIVVAEDIENRSQTFSHEVVLKLDIYVIV